MWISKKCIFLMMMIKPALTFHWMLARTASYIVGTPFQDTTASSELEPTNNFYLFII